MEQDKRYLMLPRGVLHMSALGRFGRFTLFHHLSHLPTTLAVSLFVFVGVWGLGVFVALSCFCFLFCKCYGISNSPRVIRSR